jgi:hypothetical protein
VEGVFDLLEGCFVVARPKGVSGNVGVVEGADLAEVDVAEGQVGYVGVPSGEVVGVGLVVEVGLTHGLFEVGFGGEWFDVSDEEPVVFNVLGVEEDLEFRRGSELVAFVGGLGLRGFLGGSIEVCFIALEDGGVCIVVVGWGWFLGDAHDVFVDG